MKNNDFLSKLVDQNGWRLLDYTSTHVLVERDHSPTGQDQRFATLGWDTNSDHLFWGHYDLTLEEAVQSLKERK
jgi:hypothetical protein